MCKALGWWILVDAWTNASGLMAITWCAAYGHVCAVLLMGEDLGMSQASQNVGNMLCGLLCDGQKPHDLLRNGL